MASTLTLDFTGSPTITRMQQQDPPWKVVRAFRTEDGGALVHLHNVSGGVLGGDDLSLNVTVGPGAAAQLTSTGATRLYRSAGAIANHTITVRVSGLLEYLPDEVIPFAGSRYAQQTRIAIEGDAGLFWWEVIAPGREAAGELFAYKHLSFDTVIRVEDRLQAIERFDLSERPWLGRFSHMATFYICHTGRHDWPGLEARLREMNQPEALWGVSTLPAHGLIVRGLATRSRFLFRGLTEYWKTAKHALYGTAAVPPRKLY